MVDPVTNNLEGRPAIFGEVLFDTFPDGTCVLGGAPFNVAWHLQGFGLRPLLISRIGQDKAGQSVVERMREWGMDDAGIQQDELHPTGQVQVILHQHQPTFSILPDQAYDFIDAEQALRLFRDAPFCMLYHGSLITRSSIAASTLGRLGRLSLPLFFDVNLRPPWWEIKFLREQLRAACWVKMNDGELVQLASGEGEDDNSLEEKAQGMFTEFQLRSLIITCGASGEFLITENGKFTPSPPPAMRNLVDTVGAGDAFSAVMMLASMRNWSWPQAMQRAREFARQICGLRGATSAGPDIYHHYRKKWGIGA